MLHLAPMCSTVPPPRIKQAAAYGGTSRGERIDLSVAWASMVNRGCHQPHSRDRTAIGSRQAEPAIITGPERTRRIGPSNVTASL